MISAFNYLKDWLNIHFESNAEETQSFLNKKISTNATKKTFQTPL